MPKFHACHACHDVTVKNSDYILHFLMYFTAVTSPAYTTSLTMNISSHHPMHCIHTHAVSKKGGSRESSCSGQGEFRMASICVASSTATDG